MILVRTLCPFTLELSEGFRVYSPTGQLLAVGAVGQWAAYRDLSAADCQRVARLAGLQATEGEGTADRWQVDGEQGRQGHTQAGYAPCR